jgi:hypothetical protein
VIAAVQNVRLLLKSRIKPVMAKTAALAEEVCRVFSSAQSVPTAVLAPCEVVTYSRADTKMASGTFEGFGNTP